MPCPSSNIPLRKSNTWDIHNLIHHDLIHDTYFWNKIPIVSYHYYTCNVQIVFSSIITLIAINYSFLFPFFFFFCIAGGTWRFCVATSHFLVAGRNTVGPGWPSVATAGTSMGSQMWYNYCICLVSVDHHWYSTYKTERWIIRKKALIAIPGKRESIDSHCFWFLDKVKNLLRHHKEVENKNLTQFLFQCNTVGL